MKSNLDVLIERYEESLNVAKSGDSIVVIRQKLCLCLDTYTGICNLMASLNIGDKFISDKISEKIPAHSMFRKHIIDALQFRLNFLTSIKEEYDRQRENTSTN